MEVVGLGVDLEKATESLHRDDRTGLCFYSR